MGKIDKINKALVLIFVFLFVLNTCLFLYYGLKVKADEIGVIDEFQENEQFQEFEEISTETITYENQFLIYDDLFYQGAEINITGLYPNFKPKLFNVYGETLEIGDDIKSPYNPYQILDDYTTLNINNGNFEKNIPLNYNLHSLPNGVQDSIKYDFVNNTSVLEKTIGKIVFTGNEYIALSSGLFSYGIGESFNVNSQITVRCTHFIGYPYNTVYNNKIAQNGLYGVGQAIGSVRFYADFVDVTAFKAFLTQQYNEGTPVTVYYQLYAPVVTPIDNIDLTLYYPNTNLLVTKGNMDLSLYYVDDLLSYELLNTMSMVVDKLDANNKFVKNIFALLIVFFVLNISFRGWKG